MKPLILLGDEAVGQAAIDAGITGAFSYPGTPATEIFEYVHSKKPEDREIHTLWSVNEKVAYEEALGVSYAGKRSIVSMKHVGLNVAADPFMNSGITGADGGLVVCVADDPGMHSSQNEQDTRYYSEFGFVPCFEPATQQEAYDMTYAAFGFSEKVRLPVLIRLVTRLAHSRSTVVPMVRLMQKPLKIVEESRYYTLLPLNARRNYAELVERWPKVEKELWKLPFNKLELQGKKLGVIVSGIAFNYFMENAGANGGGLSYLKVGTFPMPRVLLKRLVAHCDEILVIEDGYPYMESSLKGVLDCAPKPIHGKLDGSLPRTGELTPAAVREALGMEPLERASERVEALSARPPALCNGCPHRDTFKALNEVMKDFPDVKTLSDIGCYTLGALPPFNSIHSCVDMGASVSMAFGAAVAGMQPCVTVIGDSTFAHSGITPLLDAVRDKTNMVLMILDNGITAMTGQQDSALTGEALIKLLKGVGVDPAHIRTFNPIPKNHEENVKVLREEIAHEGLSVVIPQRPCIQIKR